MKKAVCISFGIGVILGTILFNFVPMLKPAEGYRGDFANAIRDVEFNYNELCGYIFQTRFLELAVVLLVVFVPASRKLLLVVWGYLGFAISSSICIWVKNYALKGVALYVASVMPQGVMYLMVLYMADRLEIRKKRMSIRHKMAYISCIGICFLLGVLLEGYINVCFFQKSIDLLHLNNYNY